MAMLIQDENRHDVNMKIFHSYKSRSMLYTAVFILTSSQRANIYIVLEVDRNKSGAIKKERECHITIFCSTTTEPV